ncbi:hypothetical protein EYF80_056159 [Liparis tanakae]|uniref:Uncharacterized protein n=1 Tax=Liparis tanakae TaxID=230148 RepID=A0A4Z2EYL6_9TELE|nr:hypothetical protein EYF80_056159 [Liparis tanakae]
MRGSTLIREFNVKVKPGAGEPGSLDRRRRAAEQIIISRKQGASSADNGAGGRGSDVVGRREGQ